MTAALYIKDPAVSALAEEVRKALNAPSKTEAVRIALQSQLDKTKAQEPLAARLSRIQDMVAEYPRTGLAADKAFYDDLGGDL
jgi:antitoxin VapB